MIHMKKWNLKGGMLVMSMLLLLTGCSGEKEDVGHHYDRGLQIEGWSVTEEFTLE